MNEPQPTGRRIDQVEIPPSRTIDFAHNLPVIEDRFLMNAGHAEFLFEKGWIPDENVYAVTDDVNKYVYVDLNSLLSKSEFRQNPQFQDELLRNVDNQLRQLNLQQFDNMIEYYTERYNKETDPKKKANWEKAASDQSYRRTRISLQIKMREMCARTFLSEALHTIPSIKNLDNYKPLVTTIDYDENKSYD